MKVMRAEAMGFCFGVRDALKLTETIPDPELVTIHGELVHNEAVQQHLKRRGFQTTPEDQRQSLPETANVLITAHGTSHKERLRLEQAGKHLIDTTCPLVRHVHETAQTLSADGYHIIVIGRAGHVEVQGIVEDLQNYDIVSDPADVRDWQKPKLGIVCQTTTPPWLAEQIRSEIATQNPRSEIHFQNTICQPTRDRQQAVERLCRQVDVMIVVGGANSNNTQQLALLCQRQGMPTYRVRTADDLLPDWFQDCRSVGLTAGTSTQDETTQAVHDWLVNFPESM